LTDTGGNVVEQLVYDSFGTSSGSSRTRYGYTGRERDPNTALDYYRARWYDPMVGRFISEDPIGFAGGINWFVYAHDNPIKYIDPTGLTIWLCSRLTHPPEKWVGANHAYFFDDRNNESCGLSGPRKSRYPFYGSTSPEKGPSGDSCRPIDGSGDPNKGNQIMNCCKDYKAVTYVPGYSDCHNLTDGCIASAGLKNPGAPGGRFGDRCVSCGKPSPWWKIW